MNIGLNSLLTIAKPIHFDDSDILRKQTEALAEERKKKDEQDKQKAAQKGSSYPWLEPLMHLKVEVYARKLLK